MTGEGLNKMQCSKGRGKKLNFGEGGTGSELCKERHGGATGARCHRAG